MNFDNYGAPMNFDSPGKRTAGFESQHAFRRAQSAWAPMRPHLHALRRWLLFGALVASLGLGCATDDESMEGSAITSSSHAADETFPDENPHAGSEATPETLPSSVDTATGEESTASTSGETPPMSSATSSSPSTSQSAGEPFVPDTRESDGFCYRPDGVPLGRLAWFMEMGHIVSGTVVDVEPIVDRIWLASTGEIYSMGDSSLPGSCAQGLTGRVGLRVTAELEWSVPDFRDHDADGLYTIIVSPLSELAYNVVLVPGDSGTPEMRWHPSPGQPQIESTAEPFTSGARFLARALPVEGRPGVLDSGRGLQIIGLNADGRIASMREWHGCFVGDYEELGIFSADDMRTVLEERVAEGELSDTPTVRPETTYEYSICSGH